MNADELNKQQDFLDYIAAFPHFHRDDGRMLLEPFCVGLSHCFGHDGILELGPRPNAIYDLLISTISERLGKADLKRNVEFQRKVDWTPADAWMFPNRTMTCVHVSALLLVGNYWITDIGCRLMNLEIPPERPEYFGWIDPKWIAVDIFIRGYHNGLFALLKKLDHSWISGSSGFSHFEALHHSQRRNISYDEAVAILKARHQAYADALEQIDKAVSAGYFLEAIALEECLISNCLYNYLSATDVHLNTASFNGLLKIIQKNGYSDQEFPVERMAQVDSWRMSRNSAIHGFITTRSDALPKSRQEFAGMARETATKGQELCRAVVAWYERECVNFIPHEFPSRRPMH
ncbi:MAG: hypothetical protein V4468_16880 [Pseudomonadota bacterium]